MLRFPRESVHAASRGGIGKGNRSFKPVTGGLNLRGLGLEIVKFRGIALKILALTSTGCLCDTFSMNMVVAYNSINLALIDMVEARVKDRIRKKAIDDYEGERQSTGGDGDSIANKIKNRIESEAPAAINSALSTKFLWVETKQRERGIFILRLISSVLLATFIAAVAVAAFFVCPLALAIPIIIGSGLLIGFRIVGLVIGVSQYQKVVQPPQAQPDSLGSNQSQPTQPSSTVSASTSVPLPTQLTVVSASTPANPRMQKQQPSATLACRILGPVLCSAAALCGIAAAVTFLLGLWPVALGLFAAMVTCVTVKGICDGISIFSMVDLKSITAPEIIAKSISIIVISVIWVTLLAAPVVIPLFFFPLAAVFPPLLLVSYFFPSFLDHFVTPLVADCAMGPSTQGQPS
jgi:hypothetical protein